MTAKVIKMTISNEKALQDYEDARDLLNKIANSMKTSDEDKKQANKKLQQLENDFIDQQIDDIEARTQKYQEFINNMNQLLNNIDKEGLPNEINKLTQIVNEGSQLLKSN